MIQLPVKAKINLESGQIDLEYADVDESVLADFFLEAYKRLPKDEKERST